MIHIVSYPDNGNTVTFLFNPEDGFLYRRVDGKETIMGRPENFVFPYVPLPQHMKTYPAKTLALFCKKWLDSQKAA